MMIEIRKHKSRRVKNVNGELLRTEYYYTVAKRCLWFFWRSMKFYPGQDPCFPGWRAIPYDKERPMVVRILDEKRVAFRYEISYDATKFDNEADAIRVKLDIIQHPDKYEEV